MERDIMNGIKNEFNLYCMVFELHMSLKEIEYLLNKLNLEYQNKKNMYPSHRRTSFKEITYIYLYDINLFIILEIENYHYTLRVDNTLNIENIKSYDIMSCDDLKHKIIINDYSRVNRFYENIFEKYKK
jgi:hypothetical protein